MGENISKHTQQQSSWLFYTLSILLTLISLSLIFLSLSIRTILFPIVSIDYTASLIHWMNALTSPGLSAFQSQFANYAPLYLYFLKGLTLLPFSYLYSIKGLTLVFDVILSVVAVLIIKEKKPAYNWPIFFLIGAAVFSIPTVILNGAAWAQVDAAYTVFILVSLYYMLKDKPAHSTIAYAVAFCFKLQAVFFLPIIIGYLLSKRGKISYAIFIPLIFGLSILPAVLNGGSFKTWSTVYLQQVEESPLLTRFAPSVFSFMDPNNLSPENHPVAPKLGIIAALLVAITVSILMARYRLYQYQTICIGLSLLCVIAIPFFLPYMHERYFYVADVLSLIFIFYKPSLFIIPIAVITASFYSYLPFLSATVPQIGNYIVNQAYLGGLMLLALLILTGWLTLQLQKNTHLNN